MRNVILMLIALTLSQPGFADTVTQFNGDSVCKGISINGATGTDSKGNVAVKFVVQNGDVIQSHYKIVNGALWYIPQDGSPAFPSVDKTVTTDDTAALQIRLDALEARITKLESGK